MPGHRRSAAERAADPQAGPQAEPAGSAHNPVQAAGAVCWRRDPASQALQLLLVHSARWDEWSWPKGKLEPDESAPEAAVREVGEETGVRIVLGPPLPSTAYVMPDGRHKLVQYWAGTVLHTADPTASADEIAGSAWLSVDQARERLTRDSDQPMLDALLALDRAGRLDAGQLIVIRHGKAVARSDWSGDDAERPLAEVGLRQALRLARLLDCWRPEVLVSSPWSRCLGTVTPYEQESGLTIETAKALSERGYAKHPQRTQALVRELIRHPGRIALCTHRPVLAGIHAVLAEVSSPAARQQLPAKDPWLAPGQLLLAHHQRGEVFCTELH